MRVGSLVYATDQGLGILAKSFFDNGIVTDVMVVRHGRHPTHDEWYPESAQITDLRSPKQITEMIDFCWSMDAVLFFETPFHWPLIRAMKGTRTRTILMPMHECTPERLPEIPDLFLCPSKLDYDVFSKLTMFLPGNRCSYLPVPVKVPFRKRERAEVFVHNAGHGGLKGRNGTAEVIEALQYIKSKAKFIIRSQDRISVPFDEVDAGGNDGNQWGGTGRIGNCKVCFQGGTFPQSALFDEGDGFVFPEKFNGLSLPLQEARAAGMLVMCGDRFPMNTWLPTPPLIPVVSTRMNRVGPPYMPFEESVFDPRAIAAKIDEWYGRDISDYSESGREWAETMSWKVLGPKYRVLLEEIVG